MTVYGCYGPFLAIKQNLPLPCRENFCQQLMTWLRISNIAKLLAFFFNAVESKIMAYLKDFYPFDIDDSVQNMYFLK